MYLESCVIKQRCINCKEAVSLTDMERKFRVVNRLVSASSKVLFL